MTSNGRIALVTGAGSGIGRAAALALQADGYSVALAGRRAAELEKTAAMAKPEGGKMLPIPTDVGKAGAGVGAVREDKGSFRHGWTFSSTTPGWALPRCRWKI